MMLILECQVPAKSLPSLSHCQVPVKSLPVPTRLGYPWAGIAVSVSSSSCGVWCQCAFALVRVRLRVLSTLAGAFGGPSAPTSVFGATPTTSLFGAAPAVAHWQAAPGAPFSFSGTAARSAGLTSAVPAAAPAFPTIKPLFTLGATPAVATGVCCWVTSFASASAQAGSVLQVVWSPPARYSRMM
jgi:hypothetical protein